MDEDGGEKNRGEKEIEMGIFSQAGEGGWSSEFRRKAFLRFTFGSHGRAFAGDL